MPPRELKDCKAEVQFRDVVLGMTLLSTLARYVTNGQLHCASQAPQVNLYSLQFFHAVLLLYVLFCGTVYIQTPVPIVSRNLRHGYVISINFLAFCT